MQRRTAVAAASAISLSVASAVVAIGANLGALGFTAPSAASAPRSIAVTSTARSATPTATHSSGERSESEHDGRSQEARPVATGHFDD